MSAQVLFNQFAYADRLKRGGFSDDQARASAEALGDALTETVATKSDLERTEFALKADLERAEFALKADFERNASTHKADLERIESALKADLERVASALKTDLERTESTVKTDLERTKSALKADIERVDAKIDVVRAELKTEIAATKNDLIRWILMLNIATAGLLFTAIKLFK